MWQCKNCSEQIENNFGSCWKCGYLLDGSPPEEYGEVPTDEVLPNGQLRSRLATVVQMGERTAIEPRTAEKELDTIKVGQRFKVERPKPTTENKPHICPTCGETGTGRIVNKGHFLIELVIWLTALNFFYFVVPLVVALAFSIWRRSYPSYHCYGCGGQMIPTSSPRGKKLLNEYHWRRTVLAAHSKEL